MRKMFNFSLDETQSKWHDHMTKYWKIIEHCANHIQLPVECYYLSIVYIN